MANKIQRSSLRSGPGSLTYDTLELHCKEDIKCSVKNETMRPKFAVFGEGGPRLVDSTCEIGFTPPGRITLAIINMLFPAAFRNPVMGSRIFPAADVALTILGVDGNKLTFPNAALTGVPELILTPSETAFGEATFTALIKDNTERVTPGSMYTAATAAWAGTLDDADVIMVPYDGVWNGLSIPTQNGFKVKCEIETQAVKVDGIGTVDMILTGVSWSASCVPVGWSAADLLSAVRPEGLNIGAPLRQGRNLTITGLAGGLTVTLYDAAIIEGGARWHVSDPRCDEITFVASREIAGIAPGTTIGKLAEIAITAA